MSRGRIELRIGGGIATILLDRPTKRNALTLPLLAQLDAHCAVLEADEDVRVVVLRAAGPVFGAGADLGAFAEHGPSRVLRLWTSQGLRVFDRFAALPQPTVAVLHGSAYGGGLELALAADLRVMVRGALVGLSETGIGTTPGWGGSQRLVAAVGAPRAKEMVLAGRAVDADTALAWGLVTRAVAAADLESEVAALVDALRARAPLATTLAKNLIDAAAAGVLARVTEPVAGAFTAYTRDLAEGIAAFRDKRPPGFDGT